MTACWRSVSGAAWNSSRRLVEHQITAPKTCSRATHPSGAQRASCTARRRGVRVMKPDMRIRPGWTCTASAPHVPLVLGGVEIPTARGLVGTPTPCRGPRRRERLLGSYGPRRPRHALPRHRSALGGSSSLELLRQVVALMHGRGYRVRNCDCTVIAQEPRIAPYVPQMRRNLRRRSRCPRTTCRSGHHRRRLGALGAVRASGAVVVLWAGKASSALVRLAGAERASAHQAAVKAVVVAQTGAERLAPLEAEHAVAQPQAHSVRIAWAVVDGAPGRSRRSLRRPVATGSTPAGGSGCSSTAAAPPRSWRRRRSRPYGAAREAGDGVMPPMP